MYYGWSDEGEDGDGKERRECRLPGLLYADDLDLCSEGGGPKGDGETVC